MQKRLLVVFLLLATSVFAQQNLPSNYEDVIPRYNDFPLDNIHILRLQDAAVSLGGNVTEMKVELIRFETQHSEEIQAMRAEVRALDEKLTSQMLGLQNAVQGTRPDMQMPASFKFPSYVIALLSLNLFLLVVLIGLVFWLREQYFSHKDMHPVEKKEEKPDYSDHIHPAPEELIRYVKAHIPRKSVRDIRMELLDKGWSPSLIEHAIHAARER